MTDNKKQTGRLNHLALSLSGGGVRAVGFHLGTMSMLRRLGLLRRVKILSTVSGGSMPGLGYALSQQLGRSFQDFFDDFYEFLPELNIFEELAERMVDRQPPAPSGRRDMITAMANVYHDSYFSKFFEKNYALKDGLTFDVLMRKTGRGHLEEMIFNATEFKTGTAFRFQVSEYRCLIGNGNISLCRKHASRIRIADIMAASSCIPVAMEPLFFPADFHWPDDGPWNRKKKKRVRPTCDEIERSLEQRLDTKESSIALMDGGVYDNQGLTSTLLALNRRRLKIAQPEEKGCECGTAAAGRGDPPGPREWASWMSGYTVPGVEQRYVDLSDAELDLLIVSDTPVKKASLYPRVALSRDGNPVFEEKKAPLHKLRWYERRRLGQLSKILWGVLVLLLFSAGLSLRQIWLRLRDIGDEYSVSGLLIDHAEVWLMLVIPVLLVFVTIYGLAMYKLNKARAIKNLTGRLHKKWRRKPGRYIDRLRVGDLLRMGLLRAGSVSALTSTVYMERIRGLGYSVAFSRADLKNRVLANEIFSLRDKQETDDEFHDMLRDKKAWPPPAEMHDITGRAATMGTKLWIDRKAGDAYNDLDYLVAAGQATTCYNLMQHMWTYCRDNGQWMDPDTEEVFDLALKAWQKLIEDPFSLLRDRMHKSRLADLRTRAELLEE